MATLINIPNALTVMRIFLVPIIIIFLIDDDFLPSLLLFAVSSISDGLDGFLARVLNQRTTFGAYLDPIADKALVMSCFVILAVKGIIPAWLTVLVISRDAFILCGIAVLMFMSITPEIKPSLVSKFTTAAQLVTVFAVLLLKSFVFPFGTAVILTSLYIATALLTVLSGIHYFIVGVRLINRRGDGHILP
ncbi:MAG TPA: CDP-diacylglycerol--glycerol-3-phosphate 3-phosphatidyltransferase [Syntrophales bacterium]|nr:CDP-diacylglycerol--glycerol-3-phosphate 3-phosphatidyltransferase [Syntrophales bacterium]HOL59971.1 CDP-diacylglycerol--glycerol-3-phosphate 3-phosphatidyltransferase [Syntrophales bacterium]HPO36116.1 CDP-diacylglycerol--glycerol-3-phosphate 3-phosphatidyltransferase [Syntrophales bacterium]